MIMNAKLLFSLGLSLLLFACANEGSTEENTDTSTVTTTTGTTADTTPTQSNVPFMDMMNNMMKQMHTVQMTGDADFDFATLMKHHHQGAIEMSNIEISRGQDTTLKSRAQKIIEDSQKDIQALDSFLTGYQAKAGTSQFGKKSMDKMMQMHSDTAMQRMHSGTIDQQFARMMHMHHQEGIDMSREYLKSAKQAAPRKVANSVIKENGADNKVLKSWMNKNSSDTAMHHSGHPGM